LAKKFGASSVGITLSPVQAQRANALAAAEGLSDKVLISRQLFLFWIYFTRFSRFRGNFCRIYARAAIIT